MVYSSTMTHAEIASVIKKDSGRVCTKSGANDFIIRNKGQYTLAINTWLLIVDEYTRFGAYYLKKRILRDGLLATIATADAQFLQFIRTGELDDMWASIYGELHHLTEQQRTQSTEINNSDPITIMCWILRYLKRFSVGAADKLQRETIRSFKARENINRSYDRKRFSHTFVIRLVRDELATMLPWKRLTKELQKCVDDDYAFHITPGVCAGGVKTFSKKLAYIARNVPSSVYYPFGYSNVHIDDIKWQCDWSESSNPSVLTPVPKSYKSYRMIAPEPAARAAKARALMDILGRYIPPAFPWRDQDVCKSAAQIGSVDGTYSTIDSSAASDSITKWLLRECFPTDFVQVIDPYLPIWLDCGDVDEWGNPMLHYLYSATTSGNPLTFLLEGLFFLAVVRAAERQYRLFTKEDPCVHGIVYGDDIVCSSQVYTIVCDFLSILGIKVNEQKSYTAPCAFRESCGGDYMHGMDVSSIYWPRKTLTGKSVEELLGSSRTIRDTYHDTLDSQLGIVLALIRRIYKAAPLAAHYLVECMENASLGLTHSVAGSPYPDLWGYYDTGKPVPSPYARLVHEPLSVWHSCRAHATFEKIEVTYEPEMSGYGPKIKRVYPSRSPLIDQYIYMCYLKEGPFYASDEDALLGITTSRFKSISNDSQATLGRFPK